MSLVALLAVVLGGSPGPRPATTTPRTVSLELQSADVREVLRTLADVGRVNIVVAPEVTGRVSGRFKKLAWDEALRQILRALGLTMQRDGNVIYVDKA